MQPGDVVGPGGNGPRDEKPVNETASVKVGQTTEIPTQTAGQETPEPQEPTSNWQFTEEDQPAYQQPVSHDPVSWTASEYIAHEKSGSWYGLLALATLGAAAVVFLVTREVVSTVVVGVMGIAFGAFAARKPQELAYTVDSTAIKVGEKVYPYAQFKSFTIIEEGAIDSIMLMPLQRFMPPLSIYFAPEDEDKIAEALSSYLPYEDRKQDVVDRLMRKVRF